MESDASAIQKCFEEFDPYLCSVVMSKVFEDGFLLEKSKFVALLKNRCDERPEFARCCSENVLKPLSSSRIEEPCVIKRMHDINLLYTLKFAFDPSLEIEGKVTGKALELVAESVLKWKLRNNPRLDYEFVDWRGFDYLILDKDTNDWVVGIQCKTAFHESGFLSYKKEIQDLEDFTKSFPAEKRFIMLCGCAHKSGKDRIREAFKNIGWELYYLWDYIDSFDIDPSFYGFIDAIEKSANE